MEIIKPSALNSEELIDTQSFQPLIICTDAPRVKRILDSTGYQGVQINQELAKRLLDYPKDERPNLVETTLKKLLNYHVPIYVSGFEMLFDPRYEIDVLRFFCEKARVVNVAVKWPGAFLNGQLTYASPGDPDYHEYDCRAYQVRIVQ